MLANKILITTKTESGYKIMPALAEQLAATLHRLGVQYVFGIPGGPSIPYLEAMRKNGVEFVLVSNEQSAAMMADVCGRLTGIPGVCHATFGPGATNLATGVGGALLDRSPLLAFTTEVKDSEIARKVQMNIDHQALFRPLTNGQPDCRQKTSRRHWQQLFELPHPKCPARFISVYPPISTARYRKTQRGQTLWGKRACPRLTGAYWKKPQE